MTAPINNLFLDWETYYDQNYSLKKMGTIEYIRSPLFQAHGFSVAHGDESPYWVHNEEIPYFVKEIDWAHTRMVAHNYYFDGLTLFEHHGVEPAQKVCTLSLARALLGDHNLKFDLDTLCKTLGRPGKIAGLEETKGQRTLPLPVLRNLILYANNDVDKCRFIFNLLWPLLPQKERELMSMTLRMSTIPTLNIDPKCATRELKLSSEAQNTAIKDSGYSKTRLGSNPQFAELLKSLGITPPVKLNKKGDETWAFAKDDPGFRQLIADYPEHRKIFDGRVASKSNIRRTRAERFLRIQETKPRARAGTLPIPLKYSGAHTHRWSGFDGINPQNLPRIIKKLAESGLLRKSIIAPDGYVVVVCDSSNVELRFNMWFAGQEDVLAILRAGQDVYCHTAADHFGYPVDKAMTERMFGKMLDLALGFGMGYAKLRVNAALGFMGCPEVYLSDEEAYTAVQTYRSKKWAVKNNWDFLNNQIPLMTSKAHSYEHKCVEFGYERVIMPGGLELSYQNLRCTEEGGWAYGLTTDHKLYGGLFDENIVQNIARTAVGHQLLEIDKHYDGIHMVGMCHDEGIALVREAEAEDALKIMVEEMSKSPSWAPNIPLAAEGGFAQEYSK